MTVFQAIFKRIMHSFFICGFLPLLSLYLLAGCQRKPLLLEAGHLSSLSSDMQKLQGNSGFLLADFEPDGRAPGFFDSASTNKLRKAMVYDIVPNPGADSVNQSSSCGTLTFKGGKGEAVYTDRLDGVLDFVTDTVITMKVYSAMPFKVAMTVYQPGGAQAMAFADYQLAGHLEVLTFAFSATQVETGEFDHIMLTFDYDQTSTEEVICFFDDIQSPALLYPNTLFKRVSPGTDGQLGLFLPRNYNSFWYKAHVANANILTPEETKDGDWHMYVRGSANNNSSIGMLYQPAADFHPASIESWTVRHNPVLTFDTLSDYQTKAVANPVLVNGPSDTLYMYYVGKGTDNQDKYLCAAYSTDNRGKDFTEFSGNPVRHSGDTIGYGVTTSVIFKNGMYYRFNHGGSTGPGSQMWLSESSDPFTLNPPHVVIGPGAPGCYDSKSVSAGRIFKVPGDPRWFMVYSCSAQYTDYPDRFGCAYSADLLTWTKVSNPKPFFVRGHIGQWDQGGIWSCELLSHNDSLYMYYEGWGKPGAMVNRSESYAAGGHSQLGVASVAQVDFLAWVDGL